MNQFKSYFFSVRDWEDVLKPAEYELLWKIGMDLREQGRRLIRNRKKPSRPKSSPSNWSGLLKENIYYGVDYPNMTVFAGPIRFRTGAATKPLSQPTIPAILQFGGKVWNKWEQPPDPPRTRKPLPGPRTVRVAPRPYMDKAYQQKEKKILRMTHEFIGKSPAAVFVAQNKGRTATGNKSL